LLDYTKSEAFRPEGDLTLERATVLFTSGNAGSTPARRNFDPDLDDGTGSGSAN
jgi:hypothetical protein